MNGHAADFQRLCHAIGGPFRFSDAEMIRTFGLKDFIHNNIVDTDDQIAVALKALEYFCEGFTKSERVFQFGVIVVCNYLHKHLAKLSGMASAQILSDLIQILESPHTVLTLESWISSNF